MGQGFDRWSGTIPYASAQLNPRATATEAPAPRAHTLQQEQPPPRSSCTASKEQPLLEPTREKTTQQWWPSTAKTK